MLDCFLNQSHSLHTNEIRQLALSGLLNSIQGILHFLNHSTQQSSNLLNKQNKFAETVVSKGGLNDSALEYLRNPHFIACLTASSAFTNLPKCMNSTNLQQSTLPTSTFDSSNFFPCVIGSGRLAASFLVAFQKLGIPNNNVTIISRSPLNVNTSPAIWMRIFMGDDPNINCYKHFTFDDMPSLIGKGPVFLLVKKKAFDDSQRRIWLQTFRERNNFPLMVNLMAGGALNPYDEQEFVIRANVLVSQANGTGNLLCHLPQLKRKSWQTLQPILDSLGKVLPVDDPLIQGKLTFFTSTIPLVFLTEIDRICFGNLPTEEVNGLLLQTWVERYNIIKTLMNNQHYYASEKDPALEAASLRYMGIYLGLA